MTVAMTSTLVAEGDFTDNGCWTPQTFMLRAIRDWVRSNGHEYAARAALSIDRNPTLDQILRETWPELHIERAIYPHIDVQSLDHHAEDEFDLVYSHQVLEHVPRPWLAGRELVRVVRPGGLGIHTSCAYNPRHGPPTFGDYYRFMPDGLAQLFDGVDVLIKASWGNRQAILYNAAIDDGHGALGGRRFVRAIGEQNDENFPWVTWVIFRKR